MKNFWKKYWPYIVFPAVSLAVGGLSAFLTKDAMEKFSTLNQPPLSPPTWAFSVVWSILFILMGISAAIIYKSGSGSKSDALTVYFTQLAVNFFWTILFFNFEARLLAFFWLLFLLALVILMIFKFRGISQLSAKLQIPYVIWLCFAAYLNLGVYILNK